MSNDLETIRKRFNLNRITKRLDVTSLSIYIMKFYLKLLFVFDTFVIKVSLLSV